MKFYCLNMKHRSDRLELASDEFKKHLLHVERFEAIEHQSRIVSFNLSMVAILKESVSGVTIFEDDVLFVNDQFHVHYYNAPKDWDLLYFGGNVLEDLQHHSGVWWRCLHTWTTHAVSYSQMVVDYILANFDPHGGIVFDDYLKNEIQPKFRAYICKPYVCIQRESFSDLWQQNAYYNLLETQNKLK